MIVLNDHEEVGSASTTGAGGPTLEQVLTRIVAARGGSSADLARALSRSMCISADNAHAFTRITQTDTTMDTPHRSIKDPPSNSTSISATRRHQRPLSDTQPSANGRAFPPRCSLQRTTSRVGRRSGRSATRLGIDTIDVGVPQLSMHSARTLWG